LATSESDISEALAIRDVFGGSAGKVPVTALKSYFGNCAAGCGTLELAGSLAGLKNGVVPPTLNYKQPDPECGLAVVAGEPLPVTNKTFLKVNVTRVGQASAVVVAGA
jgi:3-oxoacyl-[acyl-carrier-protein] synthase II